MFLQFGEEVEGVERFQLVEVGVAKFIEDGAIEWREKDLLVAIATGDFAGCTGRKSFAKLVFALLVTLQYFACAFDDAAR